jgi:hypothetical protein
MPITTRREIAEAYTPNAPVHLTADQAHGWELGWVAGWLARDRELPEDEQAQLRAAIANTPYGAMVAGLPSHLTAADVATWLSGFATVLAGVAERAAKQEAELRELQRQRDVARKDA